MTITPAAAIIARARKTYGASDDSFDLMIATAGIEADELHYAAYEIANESYGPAGDTEAQAERKARTTRLWDEALPDLQTYAAGCRDARYRGWSLESDGPVRRIG